ncbi:squamosa promoter-binding-like protein 1 [Impatiens glandulifera]|uniref:squamosa promoter-binding-like protein 1 n=1 Tax=Impatiens glandulifera TaxID=253017 RepID=UPI001FB0DBF8|nr:squamosa promoter-binding-like protein 1 [Impatiens glandulifera]XP_047332261.1 squamosa promoter-binding-like protein 1 [Impatiens glandulifera]XP_047332262.1 squamosa promoter-binding-like protein 1 [Impatiens glandulifera]
MEAQFGGNSHNLYGPVLPEFKALGKKSLEWDLNDWKWDGDLFTASPVNPSPADCRSSQLFPLGSNSSLSSDDITLGDARRTTELEKRRRDVIVREEEVNYEARSLNLNLVGQAHAILNSEIDTSEGKSGKKSKIFPAIPNRTVCQVDDCRTDLSNGKGYHRRHKVCEIHSKASSALVGKVMQRFCQQCSRFHVLQEFDEGKRSCRRRLAGHNKRRRKTHPENVVNSGTMIDEQGSSYLLISLLRLLSNMHTNNSEGIKDQDLLSHLLRNLSSLASTINGRDISSLLSGSQGLQQVGTSGNHHNEPLLGECGTRDVSTSRNIEKLNESLESPTPYHTNCGNPPKVRLSDATQGQMGLNNFDLNSAYDYSDDCQENIDASLAPVSTGTGSLGFSSMQHQESLKSSPPQTSRNSDSTLSQSPSSSSGDAQSRTDRIVFKLFGKDPSNLPIVLRKQILDWLSNSPTNIESYIRPGCIILTIYLRLSKSKWDELPSDLSTSLLKLINLSNNSFWNSGWVYAMVQHHVAFLYNGQVVLDTPLPIRSRNHCSILSVTPVAVTLSERAHFLIKGFNLSRSTLRLFCALEGKYLGEENCSDVLDEDDFNSTNEVHCISFTCSMPNVTGRGFLEVEEHGLSSSFFPFIVAEQDICSEIRMLEREMEVVGTFDVIQGERAEDAKNQAVDFIHEMGWLLHRSNLRHRLGKIDQNEDLFPFKRFRSIMEFSVDHGWCAVVKKLLEILSNGCVDAGDHSSIELAVSDMTLLHRAVRQNSRPVVEFLLRYIPTGTLDKSNCEDKRQPDRVGKFLFRPDTIGPGGLTPLHIVASRSGSESVLEALIDDPGLAGIEAWKKARDMTGLTPNDYASVRGYHSYINLIHKKKSNNKNMNHHQVALDIPYIPPSSSAAASSTRFEIEKNRNEFIINKQNCGICEQRLMMSSNRMKRGSSLSLYRPAMLSMVAVAAVCVCVALFFKSSPEVLYVFKPFRWEQLDYGTI